MHQSAILLDDNSPRLSIMMIIGIVFHFGSMPAFLKQVKEMLNNVKMSMLLYTGCNDKV